MSLGSLVTSMRNGASGQFWPKLIEALNDVVLRAAACGCDHTVAVTENGDVYSWGRGDSGQLGHNDFRHLSVPRLLLAPPLQRKSRMVACGTSHTLVLADNGEVYAFGNNEQGQLGVGVGEARVKSPAHVEVLKGKGTRQIACGDLHSIALTTVGEVFAWGANDYGQLGHGGAQGEALPRRVEALSGINVTQIACGDNHSMALSDTGELYAWGRGTYGALGLGTDGEKRTPQPIRLLRKKGVRDVACGADHTVVVTYQGEVYAWGRNMYGQLGLGTLADHDTPTLVSALHGKQVRQMACGAMHTVAVMEDGEVYAWGRSELGQNGIGFGVSKQKEPRHVKALKGKKMRRVACGGSHTAAVTDAGKIYAWGRDTYGQQGGGNELLSSVEPVAAAQALRQQDIAAQEAAWAMSAAQAQTSAPASSAGLSRRAQSASGPSAEPLGPSFNPFDEYGGLGPPNARRAGGPLAARPAPPSEDPAPKRGRKSPTRPRAPLWMPS
eukprot:tig00000711_g3373.t1